MRVDVAAIAALALVVSGCTAVYTPSGPDDNWTAHDTPRFTLYARPGSFCAAQAPAIEPVLEEQFDHVVAVLALQVDVRISMFLYNSGDELSPTLPSARSGVAFPDTRAVHAVCTAPFDDNLLSLLTHEANHVIVIQGLGRAGTSFMNEGLASALISDRRRPIGPLFLHQWARTHRSALLPIATLVDDSKWSSYSDAGYKTSASFLAWLLEHYGRDRLRALYPASSGEIARRATEIYGRTLEQLESEWLAFVR